MKLDCLAAGDAGRMLGISRSTVWRRVQHGRLQAIPALQAIPTGRFTLIPLYEVAEQMGVTLSEALGIAEERGILIHIAWIEKVTGADG